MIPKFRFYIILTCCSALLFFVFYKFLSKDETPIFERTIVESENILHKQKLNPMKNVNELLSITQPSHHLQKQKLREAEVHAKIRQQAMKQQFFNFGFLRNLSKSYMLQIPPKIHHRVVHLDLKGAPPTIGYLIKLFPLLKDLHVTGLLIEYEDMFPFWGELETFKAFNAYSRFEIQQLLEATKKYNFEVIPLVQTFGHLEFVLKQSRHAHMREVPEYPQVVCPSRNTTQQMLRRMIDQVVELHKGIKWLHIGADEVYYIGRCSLCQAHMEKHTLDIEALFLEHVTSIARYVKDKHHIQPIMWDDMFRNIPSSTLQDSQINKYVELMVWKYTPTVEEDLIPEMWEKYSLLFPTLWVASSFKGSTGSDQQMPNIEYHLDNQYAWLKLISKYQNRILFRGIALTGWQRYDHFAVLCELLPASVPSLAVTLTYIDKGKIDSTILDETNTRLGCLKGVLNFTADGWKESHCTFPGAKVFQGIQRLTQLKASLKRLERNSHVRGWVTDYHVHMKFGSPAHIEIGTRDLNALTINATLLYTFMENVMGEMFDKYTIQEWLETNMDPILRDIKAIRKRVDRLIGVSSWPRRPLIDSKDKYSNIIINNNNSNNNYKEKRNSLKELAALNRSTDL